MTKRTLNDIYEDVATHPFFGYAAVFMAGVLCGVIYVFIMVGSQLHQVTKDIHCTYLGDGRWGNCTTTKGE